MKNKINVKTIVIVSVLVLVIVLGVIGINTARTFMSGAASDYEPKGVLGTSSADGKSATITWTSDKESTGVVQYGTNAASLVLTTPEEAAKTLNHRVSLTTLKANTTYFFRIVVGGETFDNEGTPFTFKTKGVDEDAVPTVVPTVVAPSPTVKSGDSTGSATICAKGVDYTGDGIVNSLDLLTCKRKSGTATGSGSVKGATVTNCNTVGDYNKDGITNSLDRLKCLQDHKR